MRKVRARSLRCDALAYCCSHFGKSLVWVAADMLTLYALISIYYIAPEIAGQIFLLSLVWSALCDIGVGRWLDRQPHLRFSGRYLLCANAGSALTFLIAFAAAQFGALLALAAALLFRLAYSLYDVPHNALMGTLTGNGHDPITLSRLRTFGTGLAGVTIGVAVLLVFDMTPRPEFALLTIASGVCVVSLLLGCGLLPVLRHLHTPTISHVPFERWRPSNAIILLCAATPLGIIVLSALSKALIQQSDGALGWALAAGDQSSAPHVGIVLAWLTFGRLLAAIPLPFKRAAGQGRWLAHSYLLACVVILLLTINQSPVTLLALGLAMGAINQFSWSKLADATSSTTAFGLFAMASKVALGLSGLVLTASLGEAREISADDFAVLAFTAATTCGVLGFVMTGDRGLKTRPERRTK